MMLWDLPHARRGQQSSRKAWDDHLSTGKPLTHCAQIWAFLKGKGPMTSKEIARATGIDRHAVARRLPDLHKLGKAYKTKDGDNEIKWTA